MTAKPFALTREYFEDVYKLTNSPKIASVLANWDSYTQDEPASEESSINGVNGTHEGFGSAA